MPYSREHKQQTRARIIEAARILFNRHGFSGVSIDMVMAHAGLTRGGFYNHFKSKEALHSEAVASFLMGRGAQWREEAGVTASTPGPEAARNMIKGYLSPEHLEDRDSQCPMIALPSDVARANPDVQAAYQQLLTAMIGTFEAGTEEAPGTSRQNALSIAALCVGGMVLARTLPNTELSEELRSAAFETATAMAVE